MCDREMEDNTEWTIISEDGINNNEFGRKNQELIFSDKFEELSSKLGSWQESADIRLDNILKKQDSVSDNLQKLNSLFFELNKNLQTFSNSTNELGLKISDVKSNLDNMRSDISKIEESEVIDSSCRRQQDEIYSSSLNNINKQLNDFNISLEMIHSGTIGTDIAKIMSKINTLYDTVSQQEEREKNLRIRNYHSNGAAWPFMPSHISPLNTMLGNASESID